MSIYALQQAFACCTQENEVQALKNLVSAYMTKRKAAQEPVYRVDLIKHKKAVYVAPDNTMRLNWNE